MKKIIEYFKIFITTFLDLLYPERGICFICEKFDENLDDKHICKECKNKLIFIGENRCIVCGKPLELGYLPDKCPDCIQNDRYFTKAVSSLEYTGIIKKAIYKYKYQKKAYMYKAFGPIIMEALDKSGFPDIDVIVPVPLHKSRMRERGFNQSELLAKYISKKTGTSMDSKNLYRIKSTKVQNELNKDQREKNIKKAFRVKDNQVFKNKTILLVDDILTTGATLNECSKELLKSGANEIYAVTIATGKNL